jgi:ribosomal protein S16
MSGWWQCIGVNGSGMTVPFFDDDDRIVFRANQRAAIGDPVRIEGRQGLWRYTARAGAYIEVVGPYFPNSPSRNGERQRIFAIDTARYPGKKITARDVAPSPQVTAMSEQAQRGRRK